MEELVRQALSILKGMWQYRWPALIASWVAAIVGIVVVYKIPDQFEASARIYVDTQSILKPLMAGMTVQPNVQQQVAMLSRTLVSRPNVEKLIRMADLDLKSVSKMEQEELIARLTQEIQIRNTGRDNLYTLNYRDTDPEKAKRVIQSLVSIFIESSLGASRKDTDSARTFLAEQIKQHEAKLDEAEAKLKAFKIRNIDMDVGDGKSALGRVQDAYKALEQARLELKEAENAREAAKAQLQQTQQMMAAMKMPAPAASAPNVPDESAFPIATPEVDARIATQKQNLDALMQRYTDQHPDVVSTKRLLRDLEDQRKKEVEQLRAQAKARPRAAMPSMPDLPDMSGTQEVQRVLAAAEVQVASLKARVAEFTSRHAAAREGLKLAPQVESEYSQLTRDYDVIKRNYQALISKRESAALSGELDVAAGIAEFRLIDPPRVSPKPVAPNRLAMLPVAMIISLALGVAIAFIAAGLRPVFSDAAQLRDKTGVPTLGVVSLSLTDQQRRDERRGLLQFYAASAGLFGVFAFGFIGVGFLGRAGG